MKTTEEKIILVKKGIYRDGGTEMYIVKDSDKDLKSIEEAQALQKYYIDGRFKSKTKGELFDKYPKEHDAKQLDKSKFIFEV